MRALIVFLVMLCSCYSQEEINPQMELSVSDEQLIVTFTGGGLYSSTDLKSWSFVTTESSYKTSFVEEKFFYRVSPTIRIPIIAFVGQSNSVGARNVPAVEPYISEEIPINISQALSTNTRQVGELRYWDTINDSIGGDVTASYGGSYFFIRSLYNSSYRENEADHQRFAIVHTGGGGMPAWSFNTGAHYTQHISSISSTIDKLESDNPNTEYYLDTVIINQGERESTTGANWRGNWSSHIDKTRAIFGANVTYIIEPLNNENLMNNATRLKWDQTRGHQLALITGSGSSFERDNVYLSDSNLLFPETDETIYRGSFTDGGIHYNREGYKLLGEQTYRIFKSLKGF